MELPESTIPDPREAPQITWGVLAPGRIAHTFVEAVQVGTGSRVAAVGSRDLTRATAFAKTHGIERAYGSYEELASDPGIDAIYVASPASEHRDHALLALAHGKPVLVEKAFARSAAEAGTVFAAARRSGILAVEAMWSRFLPHYDVVARVVTSGMLGDIVSIGADHGLNLHPDGPARWGDPRLAGGSLLALGIYPASFADLVLNPIGQTVTGLSAAATFTPSGVDATTTISLSTDGGVQVQLSSSMTGHSPCRAYVAGTRARLEIEPWFYQPATIRLIDSDDRLLDARSGMLPAHQRGFSFEIAEFARSLRAGSLEAAPMPHAATIRTLRILDRVRTRIGLRYPGEPEAADNA